MDGKRFGVFSLLMSGRFRRVRLGLVLVLAGAMLICGCMHYVEVGPEEQDAALPLSSSNIRIRLNDGSEISAAAQHYVVVNTPSTFVYALGTYTIPESDREQTFAGKIEPSRVETVITGSRQVYRFTHSDGPVISCRPEDCIFVDSAGGPGIWVVGTRTVDGTSSAFRGKIDQTSIAAIEMPRENTAATTALVLGGVLALAVVIAIIAMSTFTLHWGTGHP